MKTPFYLTRAKNAKKQGRRQNRHQPGHFGQPGISDNGMIRYTSVLFTPKTRAS